MFFTYNISKPFDYLYTLIMNDLIDTTAPYVNIFICYEQQLKYLFASLYPFPQEMLNTQTSEL